MARASSRQLAIRKSFSCEKTSRRSKQQRFINFPWLMPHSAYLHGCFRLSRLVLRGSCAVIITVVRLVKAEQLLGQGQHRFEQVDGRAVLQQQRQTGDHQQLVPGSSKKDMSGLIPRPLVQSVLPICCCSFSLLARGFLAFPKHGARNLLPVGLGHSVLATRRHRRGTLDHSLFALLRETLKKKKTERD